MVKIVRKDNGITLIALVISIIVLLILAGVSINTVVGEDGILKKATNAKQQTDIESEKEGISLAVTSAKIGNSGYRNIEQVTLQEELDKIFGENVVEIENFNEKEFVIRFPERTYCLRNDGRVEDAIMISTEDELIKFMESIDSGNNYENQCIFLKNDIILTKEFKYPSKEFKGFFLGNNCRITGILINKNINDGDNYQTIGLFGQNSGIIKDLNVSGNITITSSKNNIIVGLLVGLNSGSIINCKTEGNITINAYQSTGYFAVGGINGQNQVGGIINKCGNNVTITGQGNTVYSGGIVGSNNYNIYNSYNLGCIQINKIDSSSTIKVGGISGYNGRGNIEKCFNIGALYSDGNIGAISGSIGGSGNSEILDSKYNNDLNPVGVNVAGNRVIATKDSTLTLEIILNLINE